jgi:uncharacterized repeat protein (TIGR01451 family)
VLLLGIFGPDREVVVRVRSLPYRRALAGAAAAACALIGVQAAGLGVASAATGDSTNVPSAAAAASAVVAKPAITVALSAKVTDANTDGRTDLGDTIVWSFLVKNTGNVRLTSIAVTSARIGRTSCNLTSLSAGASTTCATDPAYAITQSDVDAGSVTNTTTASGKPSASGTVRSAPSSTTTSVSRTSALSLDSSADAQDVDGDGQIGLNDQINWSFVVTNSGTTTLTNVVVSDPAAGTVACSSTTLAPGASTPCSAPDHAVSQADVDAGHVDSTATASATKPPSGSVSSAPSSTSTVVVRTSALTLLQSAVVTDVNGNGVNDKGDSVSWTFVVTNSGTTTVSGVSVTAPAAGQINCSTRTLAPGAAATCLSAAHLISQADVDAGAITSLATAGGTAPGGAAVVAASSSVMTLISRSSALFLASTAVSSDTNADFRIDLGDRITWSFTVTNTGTTTLTGVDVTAPLAGDVTCAATQLSPGQSTSCSGVAHPVSQADVDAGVVADTETAHGSDPQGADVQSNSTTNAIPVSQTQRLTLAMSAATTDADVDGRTDLGDSITWTYVLKNAGTTTLSGPNVIDSIDGSVSCPAGPMAPGSSLTCTSVSHVVNQADVDGGVVSNTATGHGTSPAGKDIASKAASTDTAVAQAPALSLTTSSAVTDVDADGATDLGDVVNWSFGLLNSGTTTLTALTVLDSDAGVVTCLATTLAPGEATTCAGAPRTVLQTDVDAGVVSTTATASGTAPAGNLVASNSSTSDTPVARAAALSVVASGVATDVDGDGLTDLGDVVAWSFTLQNTGTTTLTQATVTDAGVGQVSCPATVLDPGESINCSAAAGQTISQGDVDAGVVSTTATASAAAPDGAVVVAPLSSADVAVAQVAALTLTNAALASDLNGDFRIDLGDTLSWSFLVQNTGTVTITGIAVDDPTAGPVTCPSSVLAPGAGEICTAADHTINQADVDAGVVASSATADGTDLAGSGVQSNTSSTATPVAG